MKARRMLGLVSVTTAMLTAVVLLYGCGGESTKETTLSIQDTFRTSLHATRLGKATWYSRANGRIRRANQRVHHTNGLYEVPPRHQSRRHAHRPGNLSARL
jgi:hypothetical protein